MSDHASRLAAATPRCVLAPPSRAAFLKVEVHADALALAQAAADHIAEKAEQAIAQRGQFLLALSGGQTPQAMLRALAQAPIDWRRVHLLQVDERIAPLGSVARNLTQLEESLLAHVRIPAAQVHPLPVDAADPLAAMAGYEALLRQLAGEPPLLDLVQLGLGSDGHTASLLPGDPALAVTERELALSTRYQGWRRMTLTLPLLDRARQVLWLVSGADKAAVLARFVAGDAALPACRVSRESALLLCDAAAAARLMLSPLPATPLASLLR
ncbi:6-phosphogluconolactonase [Rhodocyclus tenuis]|uniref:6-phosphogluconolactonase n=1 Tax=Rhodocyclus tenuis TaxID=1066 RepID=A0A840GC72_RHOTE|nr:6-phosphogluconolactonase [Rhodocyclus tenuis]MBB4248470.1 6-phosphogluconolactonase [Rhodocyclus tenuis]